MVVKYDDDPKTLACLACIFKSLVYTTNFRTNMDNTSIHCHLFNDINTEILRSADIANQESARGEGGTEPPLNVICYISKTAYPIQLICSDFSYFLL